MKIGFIGCGAIGSCYASYLSKDHEVCVLDASAPVIESIRKNGILLDHCDPNTGDGETHVYYPAIATTDPKDIGICELVIVFVHYQILEDAVRNALPMIGEDTMIMCLQNGYGNYEEIAKVVPEEQIIIGNTAFGANPVEPGHVKHTGTGVTTMGTIKAPIERAYKAAEALKQSGFEVSVRENVMDAIWYKLCANVALNGQSALLEAQNGNIYWNPYQREVSRMVVTEAIQVANATGCNLSLEEVLEHTYDVARKTDETISSMMIDIWRKRETEIEIINGAVCKLGRKYGIPTPCNDMIYNLVKAKQSRYLGY